MRHPSAKNDGNPEVLSNELTCAWVTPQSGQNWEKDAWVLPCPEKYFNYCSLKYKIIIGGSV